jgi:hypothetical protein
MAMRNGAGMAKDTSFHPTAHFTGSAMREGLDTTARL